MNVDKVEKLKRLHLQCIKLKVNEAHYGYHHEFAQ